MFFSEELTTKIDKRYLNILGPGPPSDTLEPYGMSGYLVEGVKSDELIVWDCGDVVVACGCVVMDGCSCPELVQNGLSQPSYLYGDVLYWCCR